MPGRVREFNAIQAAGIAAALGIAMPGWGQPVNVTVNMPPAAVQTSRCRRVGGAGRRIRRGRGSARGAAGRCRKIQERYRLKSQFRRGEAAPNQGIHYTNAGTSYCVTNNKSGHTLCHFRSQANCYMLVSPARMCSLYWGFVKSKAA